MTSMRLESACRLCGLVVLGALGACSKTTPEPAPTAASASVSSATTTPPVASVAAFQDAAAAAENPAQVSIPDRFANEASKRPTGVPRIEECLAAFKKVGAEIREERQHLASPFLAAYCVGFQTGTDVHASLCEYKDEAAATKGREMSEKVSATTQNRKVHRNGGSTLTLRQGVTSPANDALVKKIVGAFMAMKPATGPAPVGSAPSPFAGASAVPMPPDQPLP